MRIHVFITAALLGLLSATHGVVAQDVAAMSDEDLFVLQRRLKDSGCYIGVLDRNRSPALEAAIKDCPSQRPVLMIETGMHTAPIERISVDAACRVMVTGSHEKTVRLWSLSDGKLLRTQRLPIDEGDLGKVNSVAMSPDGLLVAACGWDAKWKAEKPYGVYLFDTVTGTQVRHFGAFADSVFHLAFSPDGKRLAVALGGDGIRVLDVETGNELMADKDYLGASYGVIFTKNGTLYALGHDGYLRLYGQDLKRMSKSAMSVGEQPLSIAVDPTGQLLAVGYFNKVDIFDASSLSYINTTKLDNVRGSVFRSLTWSADSRYLFGASDQLVMIDSIRPNSVRWRPLANQQLRRKGPVESISVTTLAACADLIVFGTTIPSFGLLRANGTVKILGHSKIPDMQGKHAEAFKVSADGTLLRFGLKHGLTKPILFDLRAGIIKTSTVPPVARYAAIITGLNVAHWKNDVDPTLDNKRIQLEPHERSYSLVVRPDHKGFLLGTEWFLRSYDANGHVRWEEEVPGTVWGLNLARNGKLVIAACSDGTVRWYRWSDGKQLLALLVHNDGKRWIAWTPNGYYVSSVGAEDLIGWHVNRGWQQPADFFPIAYFRKYLNRPDIITLVLDTLDEDEAIKRANLAAKRPKLTKSIFSLLPR